MTKEWWYLSAFLHDAKVDKYSPLSTDFNLNGEKVPVAMNTPELVAQLGPSKTITKCVLAFTAYDSYYRIFSSYTQIDNLSQLWNSNDNAVNYNCKGSTGSWKL